MCFCGGSPCRSSGLMAVCPAQALLGQKVGIRVREAPLRKLQPPNRHRQNGGGGGLNAFRDVRSLFGQCPFGGCNFFSGASLNCCILLLLQTVFRMNITLAGGYVAKAKGLTTEFGRYNHKQLKSTIFSR